MSETLTSPFEWLYDGLPEDGLNDHASLRDDLAADGAEAAAKMTELYERDGGPLRHYGEGAHFAVGYLRPHRGNVTFYDEDGEEGVQLFGNEAVRWAVENDRLDDLFYFPCEPDDDGASDWWHCELVIPESTNSQASTDE